MVVILCVQRRNIVIMSSGVTLCIAAASAMYTSSDDVVELTEANFNREVVQSQDLWLVEFYAPW